MAQRRMFSQRIVGDEKFLEMPVSAQCLYFHLGVYADDDGFISPQKVVRMIGANPDDIKVLITKEFVIPFEGGVIIITHWKENNYIQKDRYTPTIYQKEMNRIECIQNVYKMDTQVRLGKVRLGKVRLGKVRLGKVNIVADATEWSFKEELKKMTEGERKDLKIIALYWIKKDMKFENKQQFQKNLKRELRASGNLIGYSKSQIEQSMDYCEKEYPVWTLETVFKRIGDLINKI